MLTVFLSIINFVSGSAFQGIVKAVTGVVAKISDDQAVEFGAAATAEQAVPVARMQADSQAYQARISLYRGMFWLQFALLAAYVGPLWYGPFGFAIDRYRVSRARANDFGSIAASQDVHAQVRCAPE
jgi:hypothetical protein